MARKPKSKTRARGTGTVRERGGRFEARWRVEGKEQARRFDSANAAHEFLDEQMVAQRKAKATGAKYRSPNDRGPTFAESFEGFMADRAAKGRTPSTMVSYRSVGDWYLVSRWAERRIATITPDDIEALLADLSARGLAPATQAKVMRTLGPIMKRAKRLGHIASNPMLDLDRDRKTIGRPKPTMIGSAQVELLASLADPRSAPLIMFAAFTGMRAGELAELRWRDLDFIRGRVNVERSVADISMAASKRANLPSVAPGFHVGPPKNKHSRQTVLLPSIAALLGEPGAPDDLVFTTERGDRIRWDNFRHRVWNPAVRRAVLASARVALAERCVELGLYVADDNSADALARALEDAGEDAFALASAKGSPPFPANLRIHDLRHAFVSIAYNEVGLNPRQIAEMSGHRDMATMLNVYLHVFGGWDEKLAERFEAARATARLTLIDGGKNESEPPATEPKRSRARQGVA